MNLKFKFKGYLLEIKRKQEGSALAVVLIFTIIVSSWLGVMMLLTQAALTTMKDSSAQTVSIAEQNSVEQATAVALSTIQQTSGSGVNTTDNPLENCWDANGGQTPLSVSDATNLSVQVECNSVSGSGSGTVEPESAIVLMGKRGNGSLGNGYGLSVTSNSTPFLIGGSITNYSDGWQGALKFSGTVTIPKRTDPVLFDSNGHCLYPGTDQPMLNADGTYVLCNSTDLYMIEGTGYENSLNTASKTFNFQTKTSYSTAEDMKGLGYENGSLQSCNGLTISSPNSAVTSTTTTTGGGKNKTTTTTYTSVITMTVSGSPMITDFTQPITIRGLGGGLDGVAKVFTKGTTNADGSVNISRTETGSAPVNLSVSARPSVYAYAGATWAGSAPYLTSQPGIYESTEVNYLNFLTAQSGATIMDPYGEACAYQPTGFTLKMAPGYYFFEPSNSVNWKINDSRVNIYTLGGDGTIPSINTYSSVISYKPLRLSKGSTTKSLTFNTATAHPFIVGQIVNVPSNSGLFSHKVSSKTSTSFTFVVPSATTLPRFVFPTNSYNSTYTCDSTSMTIPVDGLAQDELLENDPDGVQLEFNANSGLEISAGNIQICPINFFTRPRLSIIGEYAATNNATILNINSSAATVKIGGQIYAPTSNIKMTVGSTANVQLLRGLIASSMSVNLNNTVSNSIAVKDPKLFHGGRLFNLKLKVKNTYGQVMKTQCIVTKVDDQYGKLLPDGTRLKNNSFSVVGLSDC